jgi:hypothetical protein
LTSVAASPDIWCGQIPAHPLEAGMSEMEMNDDLETEEFSDELSDEALDRQQGGVKFPGCLSLSGCR